MQYNVNGWPIAPERGRYIGHVHDFPPEGQMRDKGLIMYYSRHDYQRRRVYQDELDYLNERIYRRKTIGNGQSWTIIITKGFIKCPN